MIKKKIFVISQRFYPEDFIVNELVLEWKRRGICVEVLTQNPSYPFDKIFSGYNNKFYLVDTWDNIKIHRIKTMLGYRRSTFLKIISYLFFSFYASIKILTILKDNRNIFVFQSGPLTRVIPAIIGVFPCFFDTL